jgi:hypothetical protein
MFEKIPGGSVVVVEGLECNLPPVGKVFNYFTNKVEQRHIYKNSDDITKQKWVVPEKPKDIKKLLKLEAKKRKEDPTYFDTVLQDYREREWDRTTNGYWFYLKGVPTYITGQHYFFLVHWTIEGNAPDFRKTDQEWHYFWEYCWYDPNCFGMLEITRRRDGKSVRLGCAIYYRTSRATEKKSGIQSKTDKDGERLFSKQIVNPMKKLESIFVPTMDRSKGSTPKSIVSFNKTSTSGQREGDDDDVKELISEIDFRSASEMAYDGDKLYVVGVDEIGKSKVSNVYKRHGVLIPCLSVGKRIVGKMIATTTVEDIGDSDKYAEGNFKRLWDESDQLHKDPKTNRTVSGLYRYFLSSDRSLDYDEFGIPDVTANYNFLINEREAKKANPAGLASHIRKFPLKVAECFWTPGDECVYDVVKIETRKDELDLINEDDLYTIGNLHWRNGVRGSGVEFVETKKGRLKFNKKFNIIEECQKINSETDVYGKFTPLQKHLRCIGIDPFDHEDISDTASGSKAAAYLYNKYNPMSELSETFLCEYLRRPEDLEEFHEDMCMLAFMSGAEMIIENNKQLLIRHCKTTGFENFVYHHGTTPGIPANTRNHLLIVDTTEIYIDKNIEKQVFKNILSDWSKFNLNKTTKFDAGMASGWALVGAYTERITSIMNKSVQKPKIYESSMFL